MLTLRQRIFIAVSIVVGLILALLLLYYFVFQPESKPRAFIDSLLKTSIIDEQNLPADNNAVPATAVPALVFSEHSPEVYAKQVARMFVERFASYSNQNNNQHLADILPLLTAKMEKWVKTQEVASSNSYQGITTRVIASRVDKISAEHATVMIDAQQEEENKSGIKITQRSGRVELVKAGEDWKVDGFYWDK